MVQNHKQTVSAAQNELHKQLLRQLLRQEGNRRCSDCGSRGPTWASINLGVFMCLNCSGVHRSLGVHTSQVRSTNLDTWLPEQVAFVEAMGNERANAFWEANLPRDLRRPPENDMAQLRTFILDKYVHRLYCVREMKNNPPTIENYTAHPFMARFLSSNGETSTYHQQQPTAAPPSAPLQQQQQQQAPAASFDLLSLDDNVDHSAAPSASNGANLWDPFIAATTTAAGAAEGAVPSIATPAPSNDNTSTNGSGGGGLDIFAELERSSSSRASEASSAATGPLPPIIQVQPQVQVQPKVPAVVPPPPAAHDPFADMAAIRVQPAAPMNSTVSLAQPAPTAVNTVNTSSGTARIGVVPPTCTAPPTKYPLSSSLTTSAGNTSTPAGAAAAEFNSLGMKNALNGSGSVRSGPLVNGSALNHQQEQGAERGHKATLSHEAILAMFDQPARSLS